eukprot:TRINITY_DN8061_c0_g1_i1.p2 TRINITY_DN8061_c0_g1~~TRINITY_DN8061_c0_g1_i1.p2  ORF type:complete len:204 (-),score=117.09 TRINITY_DN8061_c0_g1_i1:150-722(-)
MSDNTSNAYDLKQVLSQIASNDSALTTLNLNSYQLIGDDKSTQPTFENAIALAQALANNTSVTNLQMSNAQVNTEAAREIAKMLETNSTLAILNLETNDISGDGIVAIAEALRKNSTLTELKLTNQLKIIPSDVERSLPKIIEDNQSLQKFVVSLREQSCRNAIDKTIFRNKDIARQKRVNAKKLADAQK